MRKIILLILLMPMLASAQYFDVFDIDTSEYPIMKAKFYSIDANGKQILNHSPTDFEITENGEPRDVISVSCSFNEIKPLSIVLAVDVSESMSGNNLKIVKDAIFTLVDLLPNNGSELAIIAFNDNNYFISDFTKDKDKLKSNVNGLTASGGTSFDAALINPLSSAILAMENSKYDNKNVVLLTDGAAFGDRNKIVNEANIQNTKIFSMVIGNIVPDLLSKISQETGGKLYSNILSQNDVKISFNSIFKSFLYKTCTVEWRSGIICESDLNIVFRNKLNPLIANKSINLDENKLKKLELSQDFINYGNIKEGNYEDRIIEVSSKDGDQTIDQITFEPDLGYFEIQNQLPIELKKGKSLELKIRFRAKDKLKVISKAIISTNYCEITVDLLAGNINSPIARKTLQLVKPNGGEIYAAGIDTSIVWSGIEKKDSVLLEYSLDNGNEWNFLSNNSKYFKFNWETPLVESDECLVRVTQEYFPEKLEGEIEWVKSIGDSLSENGYVTKQVSDGGFIIVGTTNSIAGTKLISNTYYDFWVVKLNSEREIDWVYSLKSFLDDYAKSVIELSDGGFLVIGDYTNQSSSQEVTLLKLDKNGNREWLKFLGSNSSDSAIDIDILSDNNYLILAEIRSATKDVNEYFGSDDVWLTLVDDFGNLLWQKTIGGSLSEIGVTVKKTSDGGFVICLNSESQDYGFEENLGGFDSWVFKFDKFRNIEWKKNYGTDKDNFSTDIIETSDRGFILVSNTISGFFKKLNYNIYKLDNLGNVLWERTGPDNLEVVCISLTDEDEIIVGGNYENDYWIMKLNEMGDIIFEKSFGGTKTEKLSSISKVIDDGHILTGFSESKDEDVLNNFGEKDIWIVKLAGPPRALQSDKSDAVFSIIIPEPVIQNNDIDMGQMIVGSTKDTIVSSVICNTGDAPLHVLGVDLTSGDIGDFLIPRGAGDFFLKKDQCQDMMFEFTPSALGNRTAVATIRTTIGDFTDTINIRGVGIDPLIEATSEVVDFGQFELGDGKDTTLFLVKNVGSTDITITDTRISGPDMEQFSLYTTPITFTIPAGEEKEFQLNYTAKLGGRTSSILEFHFNGVGSPLRSMLFAEGIGGEVYPQIPDAYVGENVELGIFLGKIKPEGLSEIATNFSATVSYNSTLLAPIDKSMNVTTEFDKSYISVNGQLSSDSQIAAIPMKVGLGTADRSGLVITEFQLYNSKGDSVDYDIEPGVGEFNILGICEEGGKRLLNPNSEVTTLKLLPNSTSTQTTAEVTLIESGETELSIFDLSGNKVQTVYSGTPNIGKEQISIDVSNLANGRYYIKLTTPTITKTEILEVVR